MTECDIPQEPTPTRSSPVRSAILQILAPIRSGRTLRLERWLESVNQKLLKYYLAFEKGTMSHEDAAPRIRELRAEQTKLQRARDEALAELEDTVPKELNAEHVLEYVKDFSALLSKGTLVEQEAFMTSFIKGIDFEPGLVAISYAIPMSMEKDGRYNREVLSIGSTGDPTKYV